MIKSPKFQSDIAILSQEKTGFLLENECLKIKLSLLSVCTNR